MPRQHYTNFPDITQEESRANIEQKDKIVRNISIKGKKERVSKQKLLKGCHQGQNVTVLIMFAVLF